MRYADYKEHRQHGSFEFPIAYYHITSSHPRYNMSYHWHTEYEIIRILAGELHLTLDGRELTLTEGSVVFLQDGVLHGGIPTDCIYECLVFDLKALLKEKSSCMKQLQRILNHSSTVHTLLPTALPEINALCSNLFHTVALANVSYEFAALGYLYQLLGLILEHHLYSDSAEPTTKSRQRLYQFKNVLSLIEEKYGDTLTLEDLSNSAGMTPKYFCRFFREMTQRTPIDYLNHYRIECACTQLSAANASITEIALSCGFNDISYFIKTFKKYMSVTPRQYRKIHHSEITP